MSKLWSLADFYARLNAAVRETGTAKAFAEKVGLSEAYVSDVVRAKKAPAEQIAAAVGLRPVTMFVEIRQSANSKEAA